MANMAHTVREIWLWLAATVVTFALVGCAGLDKPGDALLGLWAAKAPDLQGVVLALERDPVDDHLFVARTYEVSDKDDVDTAQGLLTENGIVELRYHGEKIADVWIDQASGELVFKDTYEGGELRFARMQASH